MTQQVQKVDMVEQLDKLTWIAHFNLYRKLYPHFTFQDRKKLYTLWYKVFREGAEPFDGAFVLDCIKTVVEQHGRFLQVHELGGYQGELAWQILSKYPHISWNSMDLIKHELLSSLASNFKESVLQEELWAGDLTLNGDVFVSMHTLEHFSNSDFTRLLAYLFIQKITYLILQLPVLPEGKDWMNYYGSHVLKYGSSKIKELLGERYRLLREVMRDESARDKFKCRGWCSFWRLKDGQ